MLLKERIPDSSTRELVATGNIKQALKNIDKKLKKSPKNTSVLVNKASVLLEAEEYGPCYQICQQILDQKPLALDTDIIIILSYTLHRLHIRGGLNTIKIGDALWLDSLKARPNTRKQLNLTDAWLTNSILNSQWESLGKAATTMQRLLPSGEPSQRNFWFWGIVANILASHDLEIDLKMRSLYSELAFKTLDKAANMTLSLSEEGLPPGKWIASTSEFNLLVALGPPSDTLLKAQYQSLIKLFKTPAFAPRSKIAENQWYLSKEHYAAMAHSQLWTDLYSFTSEALEYARQHKNEWLCDDQFTWCYLVKAAVASKTIDQAITFANSFVERNGICRAPRLAIMNLVRCREADSEQSSSKSVEPILEYFDVNSRFSCAAADLRFAATQMPFEDFLTLRNQLKEKTRSGLNIAESDQLNWIVSEINGLKLDFTFIMDRTTTKGDGMSEGDKELLSELASNCIRLYGLSRCHTRKMAKTDVYPGDEACILAVKAMTALQPPTVTNAKAFLQTACLLDFLLADSEHNAAAKQAMVTVMQELGLASLALKAYECLKVKGVLHETQSGTFLAEIGSLCPRVTQAKDGFYGKLSDGLEFYRNAESQLPNSQEVALGQQNYAQAIQFDGLKTRLRLSPIRRMMNFEQRRMARLGGIPHESFGPDIDPFRPWDAEPLTRVSTSTLIKSTPKLYGGPYSMAHYIQWLEIVDRSYETVFCPNSPVPGVSQAYVNQCLELLACGEVAKLKSIQVSILACAYGIHGIVKWLRYDGDGPLEITPLIPDLQDLAKNFELVSRNAFVETSEFGIKFHPFPVALQYNHVFLALELDKVLSKLAGHLLQWLQAHKSKLTAQSLARCKDVIGALQLKVAEHTSMSRDVALRRTRMIQEWYEQTDVVQDIFGGDDKVSHEIIQLIGEQRLKRRLGEYAQSCLEALDGVVALAKLP